MQSAYFFLTKENIYTQSLRTDHFAFLAKSSPEVPDLGAFLVTDEFNLNVFHHAIISSNAVLMKVLVASLSEYESILETELPYLHLAAALGHKKLENDVKKICEFFKADKKCKDSWLTIIEDLLKNDNFKGLLQNFLDEEQCVYIFGKFKCLLAEIYQNKDEHFSAMDVAVICDNENYVDLFLQKLFPGQRLSHEIQKLLAALRIGSQLLVNSLTRAFGEDDLYKLVAVRAKEVKVEEMRMILKTKRIDPKKPRNMPNLYHIACTSGMHKVGQLNKMVSLLLEYKFDINDNSHPCTYPLYSMIYSIVCGRDADPSRVPDYLNSLQTMLKGGADPNFDENRNPPSTTQNYLPCRDPSSSALDCYFHCLQFHENWNMMEQLDQICLLLLENGTDTTYSEVNCGSLLHSLMQLSASHHAQGHLSADFFTMSRMLMYFGANPDYCPKVDESSLEVCQGYPVEFYFVRLFSLMGGRFAFSRWMKSTAVNQVAGILTYMNRDDALTAFGSICCKVDEMVASGEVGFDKEVAGHIKSTLQEYLIPVRSLQDFCRLALWRGYARRVNVLKRLHMPKRLMEGITSFFALEI